LDVDDESSESELGRLRGHLARQNPQSKAIIEDLTSKTSPRNNDKNTLDQEVLIIFNSPIQHYVPPKFYTESKPTTAKVVPTWNYAAVQIYGKATFYFEKNDETSNFLQTQMNDISQHGEVAIMGYDGKGDNPGPWKVTHAPERYIEIMKKSIIGVEIKITRMDGKFKMSQEMREGDVEGVIKGFRGLDSETARNMADIVEQRKELKAEKKLVQ
jgi:transcriptional regulator